MFLRCLSRFSSLQLRLAGVETAVSLCGGGGGGCFSCSLTNANLFNAALPPSSVCVHCRWRPCPRARELRHRRRGVPAVGAAQTATCVARCRRASQQRPDLCRDAVVGQFTTAADGGDRVGTHCSGWRRDNGRSRGRARGWSPLRPLAVHLLASHHPPACQSAGLAPPRAAAARPGNSPRSRGSLRRGATATGRRADGKEASSDELLER